MHRSSRPRPKSLVKAMNKVSAQLLKDDIGFLDDTGSHPSCGVDTSFSAKQTNSLTKEN